MPEFKNFYKKTGVKPGTLIYTGTVQSDTKLTLINFDKSTLDIQTPAPQEVTLDHTNNTWLNMEGLSDTLTFTTISNLLDLPTILLEDILHTKQRAKFERADDTFLAVIPRPVHKEGEFEWRQVSITLSKNTVVSFCEESSDIFATVFERLQSNGKIRSESSQYLFYTLIDCILDQYLNLTAFITEEIDNLEDRMLGGLHNGENFNSEIFKLKKLVLGVHKRINQLMSMIIDVKESFSSTKKPSLDLYLNDIIDHVKRCRDNTQHLRFLLTELMNQYLAIKSDHMNDIMKTLTVLSSIFIPLGFLAGLYGMNFNTDSPYNMPELKFKYGYFSLLTVMTVFVAVLLIFFKRKKWL